MYSDASPNLKALSAAHPATGESRMSLSGGRTSSSAVLQEWTSERAAFTESLEGKFVLEF
jgi:hypothetical protein